MTRKVSPYGAYVSLKESARILADLIAEVPRFASKVEEYAQKIVIWKKRVEEMETRIQELYVEQDVNSEIFNSRMKIKKFRFGDHVLEVDSKDFHDVQIQTRTEMQSLFDEMYKLKDSIYRYEVAINRVKRLDEDKKKLKDMKAEIAKLERENPEWPT